MVYIIDHRQQYLLKVATLQLVGVIFSNSDEVSSLVAVLMLLSQYLSINFLYWIPFFFFFFQTSSFINLLGSYTDFNFLLRSILSWSLSFLYFADAINAAGECLLPYIWLNLHNEKHEFTCSVICPLASVFSVWPSRRKHRFLPSPFSLFDFFGLVFLKFFNLVQFLT